MQKQGDGLPAWFTAFKQFNRVDGDCEIMPGLQLLLTPGHSFGSQSVLVKTFEGNYIIPGDLLPLYENFDECIPNNINMSMADWYESYRKVKACADFVLPMHDLRVFERETYG